MNRASKYPQPGFPPNGFTLVEMLVAVLLFGLISTIATTLTISATRSFTRTDTILSTLSGVEALRNVLAADLGQAARRPTLSADGKQMPAFTLLPQGFVLVRTGVLGTLPQVQKIAWGFDGQNLLRQTFPTLDGSPPGDAVVLASDIRGIRLRVAGDHGWQSQWRPSCPEDLPRALEMTLFRKNAPDVVLKFLVAA